MMKRTAVVLFLLAMVIPTVAAGMKEVTRHITGEETDLYFMNDKVFGVLQNRPLWAIYNCGSDIEGEIDIGGSYQRFHFQYRDEGAQRITGAFGSLKMALGKIERNGKGFTYHVIVGDKAYDFSITYKRVEAEHLVDSLIEGELDGKKISLSVDGHLCPFATTGIVLIVVGSAVLS
jgi:hypothetical protein